MYTDDDYPKHYCNSCENKVLTKTMRVRNQCQQEPYFHDHSLKKYERVNDYLLDNKYLINR